MFQPPPTVIVNHINYVKCHRARLDAPFGAKPDNEFVKTWKSNIHAPTHTIWCVSTPSNIPPLIWSKSSSVLLLYGHPFHCKKIIILAHSFFFSFFSFFVFACYQSVSQSASAVWWLMEHESKFMMFQSMILFPKRTRLLTPCFGVCLLFLRGDKADLIAGRGKRLSVSLYTTKLVCLDGFFTFVSYSLGITYQGESRLDNFPKIPKFGQNFEFFQQCFFFLISL